jgi:hypothetical protein
MKFDRIDWNKVFFKTYYKKQPFVHLLVNFNCIWVLHIPIFWYYTAFNLPMIYTPRGSIHLMTAMQWSATALGGAVATIIMITATLVEFSYILTTWNNALHLTRQLLFLCIMLGLTTGPTFYIAFFNDPKALSQVPLAITIVQLFISCVVTICSASCPLARCLVIVWQVRPTSTLQVRPSWQVTHHWIVNAHIDIPLGPHVQLQICQVIFLPQALVPRVSLHDGWYKGSRM